MIDGRPRSASVVAVRKTTLSFLSRAAFREFAGKHPDIYMNLVTLLATRLRETDVVLATGSFLPVQGPRPARIGGSFWKGCRFRPRRHSAEDRTSRPWCHGRRRPQDSQPHPQRLETAQRYKLALGLLFP